MYNKAQKFNSFSMHFTQGSNNFFPLILETRLSNCHTGFHGQHQTVHITFKGNFMLAHKPIISEKSMTKSTIIISHHD